MDQIIGTLTAAGALSGALSAQGGMSGAISIPNQIPTPAYEGEYIVIPRLYEQALETSGYRMLDDVTVRKIPVVQTTNPTGGLTVVIG